MASQTIPTIHVQQTTAAQQPNAVTSTNEPAADSPPATVPSPAIYDKGFVPRGYHREYYSDGWKTVKGYYAASDVYEDPMIFTEPNATVQIVTFYTGEDNCQQARWDRVLETVTEVKEALSRKQEPNTWRWIHCQGFHGPTMKAVAEGTDWPLDRFARIFTWARSSAEWARECLLVHLLDQMSNVCMLYKETKNNPVFITCTNSKPDRSLKMRWEDYVDFGDSRPHILLRKDPSLMLYGMMRAITQDLRADFSQKHRSMGAAYDLAMAQPSERSLRNFYELQQSLIRIRLDTTSLRVAAKTLLMFVDEMHKEAKENGGEPLVSEETRDMLRDQMGLIQLLSDELPEVTREAEAVTNLAFNTLAFSTNNLLRLLAIFTIASVPLTIVTGILGINYFDAGVVNGTTIAISLGSVSALVIIGLMIFLAWGYSRTVVPGLHKGQRRRFSGVV